MRISILISIFLLTSIQALMAGPVSDQDIYKEKVSLELNTESLLTGINKIENQMASRFFYRKNEIEELNNLQLTYNTRTVERTFTELLKNTGLSFQQGDKNILLEKDTQQADYVIRGRVTTSDHKAIQMATVRVIKVGDQKTIGTTLADFDGKFSINVFEQGDYLLTISSIETDSMTTKITVGDAKILELPDIILKPAAWQLNTVTVKAKRQMIRQEAGVIAYDLQADPQSKVSSLLDMMRKVPYLSVDGGDNLLLNGSSGYRIFINGKPSSMVEKNPKDVLRSIPASTIKSIEVISPPPSKYDAEGLAGIINIVTNKEIVNGYHGSINLSYKAPVDGPGIGGTFSFKEGAFGLSAIAGLSRNNIPETTGDLIRTTTGSSPTTLVQHTKNKTNAHTGYAGLELSYALDSLSLLSGQLNWTLNKLKRPVTQTSFLSGEDAEGYNLDNQNNNKGDGMDAALNYQLGFKANKDQLLTFSYRYLKNTNSFLNQVDLSNQVNYPLPSYSQSNAESLIEHTMQADYVQPIKKLRIEAGIKGIFRKNKSDFQYHDINPVTGEYEFNPGRSSVFNNTQDVFSAYNNYNYQGKKWQFQAGVRAEETIIKGEYNQNTGQLSQKYLNVVPAVVANWKLNESNSLSLSFSKRIQRPAIAQLNPFVNRSNPTFETSGSPDLKPITSSSTQLSYLKSGKVTLSVALVYLYFNQFINAISSYDEATKITRIRFENNGRGPIYKMNIYVSYPLTDNWSVNLNSDLRYVSFYATVNGIVIKNSGSMAYVNISTNYSFSKGWRTGAELTMNTGGVSSPQAKTNGFVASNFSVNKEVVKDALTLSMSISNPFTKFRYINDNTIGPDFLQTTNNRSFYRQFSVSLNYRFGKLKEEIKKNKRGIKNDDLSN